jgi:hypothetical protein
MRCVRMARKVTPEQFADELRKHSLATDGKFDGDSTTSIAIKDERLERTRRRLAKFDVLNRLAIREELGGIITALRRRESPEAS